MNSTWNYIDSKTEPAIILTERPSLFNGLSDETLSLLVPVGIYWVMSTAFLIIDDYELFERYRIHPPEEVVKRNKATFHDVLKDVILQHIIQTVVGYLFFYFDDKPVTGYEVHALWSLKQSFSFVPASALYYWYWYGLSAVKLAGAFVIIDTWQYWFHRLMHVNKYLYKHFHSRHHRLYVPYAFGALYNAPLEGFLLDTCGTGLAMMIAQLTPREAIVLYTFSTMKTVDDHCGYAFPWDPFQILFPNNSIYHDIHHQAFGIKTNFSQPFFTFWDSWNKTRYQALDSYRENRERINIDKYRLFLKERSQRIKGKKE